MRWDGEPDADSVSVNVGNVHWLLMLLHRRLKVVVVWDRNTLRTAPTHGQTALRRLAQADPDGWDFTRGWTVVGLRVVFLWLVRDLLCLETELDA